MYVAKPHRIDALDAAFARTPYLACDVSTRFRFRKVTREAIFTGPIKSKTELNLDSVPRRCAQN
jgi:hypothetical protein